MQAYPHGCSRSRDFGSPRRDGNGLLFNKIVEKAPLSLEHLERELNHDLYVTLRNERTHKRRLERRG